MQGFNCYYPVISTLDGNKLVDFLRQTLGFEVVFEADWYWHLSLPEHENIKIAFVQSDHESVPVAFRQPVQGLLLNFEMNDVSAFYAQHQQTEWNVVLPLKDEEWGQRHFIVAAPVPGLLLDFIEVIAPAESYQDNDVGDAVLLS